MLLAFFVDEFTAYKNQKFRFDTNMEKIGFKKCEEKKFQTDETCFPLISIDFLKNYV